MRPKSSIVSSNSISFLVSLQSFDTTIPESRHSGFSQKMHGGLAESDYHRIHAPIGGKVEEARVISGQHYALIETMDLEAEANGSEDSSI